MKQEIALIRIIIEPRMAFIVAITGFGTAETLLQNLRHSNCLSSNLELLIDFS